MAKRVQTVAELYGTVHHVWQLMASGCIREAYNSIPQRLCAVVKSEGHTAE